MSVVIIIILILLCLLILGSYLFTYIKSKTIYGIVDRIPGPPVKPIFGNLLSLTTKPDNIWKLKRSYARDYYPIYRYWAGYVPIVNLLCPEDIEIILSNPKHNKKSLVYRCLSGWLGTGLLTSYGIKWHTRRKMLTPAFHFKILQQYLVIFSEQSDIFVKQLMEECDKPYTDIIPLISQFTLKTICESALGTKLNFSNAYQLQYIKAIQRIGDIVIYRILRPWLYSQTCYKFTTTIIKEKKLQNLLHKFSESIIQTRQEKFFSDCKTSFSKRPAMLDILLLAQSQDNCIDAAGIREEVDTFMFEGHDTTAASLSFTMMLLANHKNVQDNILHEIKAVAGDTYPLSYAQLQSLRYLERVLKESLRMYPSVPFIGRITQEAVTTHTGYIIPPKCNIHIHIYDLHYNPIIYPDPFKFDPDRFLPEMVQKRHAYAYLPFSAGIRNCIGQKFAMLEMKCFLSTILRKYCLEPVDKPEDIILSSHLILRTIGGIKIKIRPRLDDM